MMKKTALVLGLFIPIAAAALLDLQARRNGLEIDVDKSVLAGGLMCASSGCHDEDSISTFNTLGSVALQGLPQVYEPATVYPLTLQIEGTAQTRVYGFELVALHSDGSAAGILQSLTVGAEVHAIEDVPIALHTPLPLDDGTVQLRWRSPVEPQGEVLFRVAANAANDNMDPSFDHINTLELTVQAPAAPVESYFAQVGDGVFEPANIRFTTSLILVNSGDVAAQAQVDFFNSAGDPFEVQLGQLGPGSSFQIELAAGSGFSAETAGTQDLAVGYMRIMAPPSVGGTAVFRRALADSGVALFETGVPASAPLGSFSLFVDQRGVRRTGLALVNTGAEEAQVTLRVFDLEGMEQSGSPAVIMLAPGEHRARFADELIMGLPVDFQQGVMQVESTVPLAAVTLRQEDDSGANPFPVSVPLLTAFPVLER